MVRRSAVETGRPSGVAEGVRPAPGPPETSPTWPDEEQVRRRRPWRGSGGRWLIWLGRVVLWAFILVVIVNGVRAPFERFTSKPAPTPASSPTSKDSFPTTAAAAFAQSFAQVYLNYDQARASERAAQLQEFLPEGADAQLGWSGTGSMQLQGSEVAGVEVRDPHHAVVTLAVKVNGRWMRLAVPVYVDAGAMAVSGEPALLPAPPRASTVPAPSTGTPDTALAGMLQDQLRAFFKAYAGNDPAALQPFLASGADVHGLAGAVSLVSLKDVWVPVGGATRHVTATVIWQVGDAAGRPGGQLEQSYDLTMTQQGDHWYVQEVRGSTRPVGP